MNTIAPLPKNDHTTKAFTVIDGRAFYMSLGRMLKTLPQDYIGTLATIQRHHGPLVHWRAMGGFMNFAFISDPAVNRELFVRHTDALKKSPSQVQTFLYAAGSSVATEHGDTWRTKRKEANALFSRAIIEAPCSGQINVVRRYASTLGQSPHDGMTLARRLAAFTTSRGILGRQISLEEAEAQIAFSQAASDRFNTESAHIVARKHWMLAPWRKSLRHHKQTAFAIVDDAIEELQRSKLPNDGLMAHFLNGTFKTSNHEEMRTTLVGLLLGAQDNTAAAISWALAYVSQDVALQDKIRGEISATGFTAEDLRNCPLLQATINEVLRLRPPAPANQPRVLRHEVEILGHRLPKGTYVFNSFYNMHHDADVFSDPETFMPERFVDSQLSRSVHFAPFGHGPRNCVAQGMATQQLAAVLSGLLLGHRLRAVRTGVPDIVQRPFLVPAAFKIALERI